MYRLADVGNSDPYKGRVEVFHNGAWGTVCDDGFNDLAANIFCKSIGYS